MVNPLSIVFLCAAVAITTTACTRYVDAVLPEPDASRADDGKTDAATDGKMTTPASPTPLALDFGENGVFSFDVNTGEDRVADIVAVNEGLAVLLESDCALLTLDKTGKLNAKFAEGGIFRSNGCRGRKLLWEDKAQRFLLAAMQGGPGTVQALTAQGEVADIAGTFPYLKFDVADVTAFALTAAGPVVAGVRTSGDTQNKYDAVAGFIRDGMGEPTRDTAHVGYADHPLAVSFDGRAVKVIGATYALDDSAPTLGFSFSLAKEGNLTLSGTFDPGKHIGHTIAGEVARMKVAADQTVYLLAAFRPVRDDKVAAWPGIVAFNADGSPRMSFGESAIVRLPPEIEWNDVIVAGSELIVIGSGKKDAPTLHMKRLDAASGKLLPPFDAAGSSAIARTENLVPRASVLSNDGHLFVAGTKGITGQALFVAKLTLETAR